LLLRGVDGTIATGGGGHQLLSNELLFPRFVEVTFVSILIFHFGPGFRAKQRSRGIELFVNPLRLILLEPIV
jgi:hypothetical protein